MNFFQQLKEIFKNFFSIFLLICKSFFHWTLNRCIIAIFSFIIAIISFIPFFLVLVVLWFIDPISWGDLFVSFVEANLFLWFLSAFSEAPLFFIIEALITVLGIAFAIGVYSYQSVLIFRLLQGYQIGKPLKIRENFHLKSLKKYINIFPIIFAYLSLPVVSYVLFFFFIVMIFGGFENVLYVVQSSAINGVSLSLFVWFVVASIVFIYMYYRLIFSYVSLALDGEQSVKEIIADSKTTSSWKNIFLIFVGVLIYGLCTVPTSSLQTNSATTSDEIGRYLFFRSLETLPSSVSFESIGLTYKNYAEIENEPDFILLDTKYSGVSLDELEIKKINADIISNVFTIIHFLIFFWMFELVIFTLYLHLSKRVPVKTSVLHRAKKLIAQEK